MCTGAEIGMILAAAGTATNSMNQYAASRKQDRIAAQGIRQQGDIQRQASARVGQHLEDFAGSTPQAEQAKSMEGFMNALRQSKASTEGDLPAVGAANPRFAEDVSAGRQRVGQEAGERAARMSRIDAPMYQRQREGSQLMRAGGDIGELERQSGAQDFLTRLRVASAQPNPWVNAAGSLMQGVGGAMSLGLGAGGAAAGAPGTAAMANPAGFGQAAKLATAPSLAAPTTLAGATNLAGFGQAAQLATAPSLAAPTTLAGATNPALMNNQFLAALRRTLTPYGGGP
jgi:hypothetical protein